MRRSIPALPVAALLGGTTAIAFFSGGFFDVPRLTAAVGAWLLVIAAAIAVPVPLPRSLAGRIALAGLAGLTAWTGASIDWAPISERATDDFQRLLLYTGALAAAAAWLRGPRARRAVEPALAAGAVAVIGYGLSGRLLPGIIDLEASGSAFGRLEQPLTYWNATGALAAIGFVLCARIAGDPSRGRAAGALAAAGSVPLAVGVYLSFSRGALAAALIGCALLAGIVRSREQIRAIAVALGAGVAAAAVANALPAVRALTGDDANAQGLAMLAALLLAAGAAAAAQAWADPRRDRALAIAGVALVVAGGIALAVNYHDTGDAVTGARAERLGSLETSRSDYWDVALATFADNPVAGVGSGGFGVEWLRERTISERVRDAHSLYFETLAELGAVGFALLLTLVGGVAAAARRALRRNAAVAAGPVAGCAVFAVHAGLDWDWEMPAVALPALMLAGVLIAMVDDDPESADDRAAGAAAAHDRTAIPA